jgi:protein-arginine kinase activator protein McsA
LTVGAVCSPSQSPLATSSSAVASPTQVTTTPTKSHKNTSNSGKSDEATTAAAVTARPSKKAELEKELAAAVEEEDYDRAADIQEELEALEKEEINEVEDIGALERAAVARAAKIVELENKKKVALGNNNFKLLSVIKGELSALEKEAKWDSLSPAKRQAALARSNKKTELERVLATAVEEEDYDRAADIQDELKLLEDEEKAAEVESKGIDEHDSAKVATSTRSPAIPQQPSSGTTEPAAVFTVGPAVTLTFVTSPASDAAAWVYALNQGQQTHEEAAKAAAQSAGVVSPNRNASAKSPSHASTSSGPAGAPTSSTTNSPSPAQASPRRWGFFGRKKQGTTTSTAANTAATPSSSSAASAPRSRLPAVAVVKGSESEESAAQKIQNLARGRRARKRTAVKRAQRGASFRAAPAVDVDASSDSEEAEENDDDDSDVSIGDVSSDDDDEKA